MLDQGTLRRTVVAPELTTRSDARSRSVPRNSNGSKSAVVSGCAVATPGKARSRRRQAASVKKWGIPCVSSGEAGVVTEPGQVQQVATDELNGVFAPSSGQQSPIGGVQGTERFGARWPLARPEARTEY